MFQLEKVIMPRYECRTGGHNKFYEIRIANYRSLERGANETPDIFSVVTAWGRIGNPPTNKFYEFRSLREANNKYDEIVSNKISKGYRLVNELTTEETREPVRSPNIDTSPTLRMPTVVKSGPVPAQKPKTALENRGQHLAEELDELFKNKEKEPNK